MNQNESSANSNYFYWIKASSFLIFCLGVYVLINWNIHLKNGNNGNYFMTFSLVELLVLSKIGIINCIIGGLFSLIAKNNIPFLKSLIYISATLTIFAILSIYLF